MCTIALLPGPAGHFILAGNRDELRTRARALPPSIQELPGGVRAIYPVDADAHGTWIGANEHGLALTLLNHYPRQAAFTPADPAWSRGQLVLSLLASPDLGALRHVLEELGPRLPHVRPFRLVAATAHHATYIVWDGDALTTSDLTAPELFVSSSFEEPRARATRKHALAGLAALTNYDDVEDPQAFVLDAFSQSTPRPGPFTVSMARPDARTVSHTFLEVSPERIRMSYHDGPPHEPESTRHDITLERRS